MQTEWTRRAALPLAVSWLLVAAGLAVRLAHPGLVEPGTSPPLALRLLDVNRERNVPTAWSVGLLLACCGAALRLSRQQRRAGWGLLAAATAAMALDEAVQVHERADALGRLLAGDGLHFAWVVPGALVAAAVGGVLLRRLRSAAPPVPRRLATAGAVYLTGALLLEALSGVVLDTAGRGAAYALMNAAEEGLEMTGASLALAALLLAGEAARRRLPVVPPVAPGTRR